MYAVFGTCTMSQVGVQCRHSFILRVSFPSNNSKVYMEREGCKVPYFPKVITVRNR
ncbi:AGAP012734-PA [Anopheles gambiae str. PEST]|uniref:AGAP012734-PA n=1 Tax=Anopheles gambiae TaxID=7165 RepID=A0NAW5_ANOGA|nr:AGAP012734-PA [Anopheles gambiae str. PEST]